VKILDDTPRGCPAIEYGPFEDRRVGTVPGNEETWILLPDGNRQSMRDGLKKLQRNTVKEVK